MATSNTSWQGYAIFAIGIFFLIVTLILYSLNVIKGNRLLMYDGVSLLIVVLGVVYVVLSRRLPEGNRVKKPQKNLKDKQRRTALT